MKNRSLLKEMLHRGAFQRSAEIRSPERLRAILDLDDALWTATGVDIDFLAMNRRFLEYLDNDRNGRLLCGEARWAIRLLDACHRDLGAPCRRDTVIPLDGIRHDTAEGRELCSSAERLLAALAAGTNAAPATATAPAGMPATATSPASATAPAPASAPGPATAPAGMPAVMPGPVTASAPVSAPGPATATSPASASAVAFPGEGRRSISLAETEACRNLFKDRPVSAEGVVLPEAAEDMELRAFLEDIVKSVDGAPHPSGRQGVNLSELEEFLSELTQRLAWFAEADADPAILPIGADTAELNARWEAIRADLRDYFILDAAAALDPAIGEESAAAAINAYRRALAADPEDVAAAGAAALAHAPLAIPDGLGVFQLDRVRDPIAKPRVRAGLAAAVSMTRAADTAAASAAPASTQAAAGSATSCVAADPDAATATGADTAAACAAVDPDADTATGDDSDAATATGAASALTSDAESALSLTREDFHRAEALLEPYRNWLGREGGRRVAFIPRQRLEYLAQGGLVDLARNLVNERGVASLGAEDIKVVERFLLFTEHLVPFLNNLVVFPYLYDPAVSALFESGSFVADGRRFAFSVKVKDVAKHKVSAAFSRMYVMYLEVYVIGGTAYKVAVPVTAGSEGRLYKGKHGLFRESDGTERDAVIVDILENPISVPETLVMPFRKAYKTVAGRIEEASRKAEDKLAKSAAERADAALSSTAAPGASAGSGSATPGAASTAPAAAPGSAAAGLQAKPGARPAAAGGIPGIGGMAGMGGMVASGGIAVAALGSSFAFIGKTLSEMSLRALLTTFGALAAAILLPVLISALSKLSSRDLSPLLEASGMAMNRRIRLTRAQARAFTVNPRRSRQEREAERERGERRKAGRESAD